MATDFLSKQDYLNNKLGTVGLTRQQCMIRLAGIAAQDATMDVASTNYAGVAGLDTNTAVKTKVGSSVAGSDNVVFTQQDMLRRL